MLISTKGRDNFLRRFFDDVQWGQEVIENTVMGRRTTIPFVNEINFFFFYVFGPSNYWLRREGGGG